MPYVYSTATAPIRYTEFKKVTKDINRPVRDVTIAGGSNVIGKNLVTPLGVATQVSEDDLEFLLANPNFRRHLDKGFMKIEKSKKDPEVVVAKGMELKDNSAQKTAESLAEEGAKLREEVENKPKRGRKSKL